MMAKAMRPPRLSWQGLKLLKSFCEATGPLAGADIMRTALISSGTLYPLLSRFEAAKILVSAWETAQPQDLHRPRRRLYRLTKHGTAFAQDALQKVKIGNVGAVR